MSRIGKRPIEVPAGVIVSVDPGRVTVSGTEGRAAPEVPQRMQIDQEEGTVTVTRPTERGEDRALHGLTRTLIANMVEGVTNGFEKKLEIQGVGYRAALAGSNLELQVGYSHTVRIVPREGISFEVADPHADRRPRHRQAGRRPDGRRDSQGPSAGALQGQGHPLRGRAGSPEGREARMSHPPFAKRGSGVIAGSAGRSAVPPRAPACSSSARTAASSRQLVDDDAGRTLASASWLDLPGSFKGDKSEQATEVGKLLAENGKKAGVEASSSTGAATCITDASNRSPTARAKED